jgi:hypothetical protein
MLTKLLSRIVSGSSMASGRRSPDRTEDPPPKAPGPQPDATERVPESVEEAERRGFEREVTRGLNLKSEGEPSGPLGPPLREKRRAARFAKVAVDPIDGDRPPSERDS